MLAPLTDWLSEGTLALQIFRVIALIGLGMAVLQVVLLSLGANHDVDFDISDGGHGAFSGVFSVTTLSGFALGFGTVGSILMGADQSIFVAALGGAASGGGVGFIFYLLMRLMNTLKEDNTFKIESCIGQIGTAYIHIPAKAPGGQVQVVAQSRMVTLAAMSDEAISSGERVRIVAVLGSDMLKVERAG